MAIGTDRVTVDYIKSHLDEDLEEIARRPGPPLIRPSLRPFLSPTGLFTLPAVTPSERRGQDNGGNSPQTITSSLSPAVHTVNLVLQVMSIKDVSLSREQRSRALLHALSSTAGNTAAAMPDGASTGVDADTAASLADATLHAMEEQQDALAQQHTPLRPSGGQWRLLRLELSDGFQRILAVEDASVRTRQLYGGLLAKEGLTLGAKVRVCLTPPAADPSSTSQPSVQHGILRLHAGNTEVLGGRVRALEVYWEAQARQLLAAITGRPSKQPQYQLSSLPDASAASATIEAAQLHPQPPSQRVEASSATQLAQQQPQPLATLPVQPLRNWPIHASQHPPQTPFCTVAFITEVVSDMVINESPPEIIQRAGNNLRTTPGPARDSFTYSLLVQLSSPNAVERDTQQQFSSSSSPSVQREEWGRVCEDDHLTVDLGHVWVRQLVGMPADEFRVLSLSHAAADVERLTQIVEAVGSALEQFGKGCFTLVQRAADGIVEVVNAAPET